MQRTGRSSDSRALKEVREMVFSSFRVFSFQSHAAANWKELRPKEVFAFGITREMYLLERRLRTGKAMVRREFRYRGVLRRIDLYIKRYQ